MCGSHAVYVTLDTIYTPAIISYVTHAYYWNAHILRALFEMQMNADQEKKIPLNVHDPSQLKAFVCAISTQPPAMAQLPAETVVVTMEKSCKTVFTDVSAPSPFTTFTTSWLPSIFFESYKMEDVASLKANTLLPLQFGSDNIYL